MAVSQSLPQFRCQVMATAQIIVSQVPTRYGYELQLATRRRISIAELNSARNNRMSRSLIFVDVKVLMSLSLPT
jgi:hypothetical protein